MYPTGDSRTPANIRKYGLVNLNDNYCRISRPQTIVIQSNIRYFVDDRVGQSIRGSLKIEGNNRVSNVGIRIDGLCVQVDYG